jgi:importin subunit alpha-1
MIDYMKQNSFPQLQLEATWALTNVASGTTGQCQSIIDKGGIPLFV